MPSGTFYVYELELVSVFELKLVELELGSGAANSLLDLSAL